MRSAQQTLTKSSGGFHGVEPKALTQSDSTADPNGAFVGFYVGGDGDVKITTCGGTDVVVAGCKAGCCYWFPCTRIWSTGTDATDILGLY